MLNVERWTLNVRLSMPHPLEELRDSALREIAEAPDEQALEALRVRYLGRSGSISVWSEQMKTLSKEERPLIGKLLNEARTAVTAELTQNSERLRAAKEAASLADVDMTLPGTPAEIGALAPITQMLDRAIAIFRRMGFALAEGPDVETEWHCFDALNTRPITRRATSRTHFIYRMAAAAHAHLDGADPHDAIRAAADSRHRAGRRLSAG